MVYGFMSYISMTCPAVQPTFPALLQSHRSLPLSGVWTGPWPQHLRRFTRLHVSCLEPVINTRGHLHYLCAPGWQMSSHTGKSWTLSGAAGGGREHRVLLVQTLLQSRRRSVHVMALVQNSVKKITDLTQGCLSAVLIMDSYNSHAVTL